ncbi:hypothetical protein BDY21DRAFT_361145 [Lineolata rhizophorae]|uniref:Uncharacterized protein n=1 Tax=Lineolata rhizophorae TaxID=578093 RepID=A0A6A6PBD9_9PEZI|nr:hypothetical protein BDY21DRAFT_361145 [Lineolata rhizophorae]
MSIRTASSNSSANSSFSSVGSTSRDRPSSSASSSMGMACAFPSWPTGTSLGPSFGHNAPNSPPSSYLSDADLWDLDLDSAQGGEMPFLSEAPAPPRMYTQATTTTALPLPPLYASEKPHKKQSSQHGQRRRSSQRKQRRTSKPMTPIAESPEAPQEERFNSILVNCQNQLNVGSQPGHETDTKRARPRNTPRADQQPEGQLPERGVRDRSPRAGRRRILFAGWGPTWASGFG